ncbi:uncharacterized protein LOC144865863 [Branchiostoma floridae x Branchiostoma japonicum]
MFFLEQVIITDARHDSVTKCDHTTVTALGMSHSKVIAISNISREEEYEAQAREVKGTLDVIDAIEGKGLKVVEGAHDNLRTINKLYREKGWKNSNDTWHATKKIPREMKKITRGKQKEEGETWFPELQDKCASTKTGFYWSMKHCGGVADNIRASILNMVEHYMGNHGKCHKTSPCQQRTWKPSKVLLKDEKSIEAYRQFLKSTEIYKNAENYVMCRDTFMVESFNNVVLIYAPKRIHFGKVNFDMRTQLAVLDWNTNVLRDTYSCVFYQDIRRPSRVAPMRVLKPKDTSFREEIWRKYYYTVY